MKVLLKTTIQRKINIKLIIFLKNYLNVLNTIINRRMYKIKDAIK